MNANPNKVLIKGDVMKKNTPPPFPQALHGKKGIRNASEILEVLRFKFQVVSITQQRNLSMWKRLT